jgi:quinol monooxygenase YgiN
MAELAGTITKTAEFDVRAADVEAALGAIGAFVAAIVHDEPGTRLYTTMSRGDDPVHFLHLMVFRDERAEAIHRSSDAVQRFTDVLYPLTIDGVRFTDFDLVASTPLGAFSD